MSYNDIIQEGGPEGGSASLKSRLIRFRKWATKSAKITVHGALCIVNGEATDGTRNAPVLVFEAARTDPRTGGGGGGGGGGSSLSSSSIGGLNNHSINSSLSASSSLGGGGGGSNAGSSSEVRCGAIDNLSDRALYDRSIGCQVRTVRELKKDEIALSIPVSAMITPDLIALSDAGQAILACCNSSTSIHSGGNDSTNHNSNFWNAFGVTSALEKMQFEKISQNSGTQLLVKILQERKRVETALMKGEEIAMQLVERGEGREDGMNPKKLAPLGSISHRAPFLAFLIHQRFANEHSPLVAENNYLISEEVPETFAPYARTLPSSVCVPICWKRNELALLAGCIPGMPALQKVAARTMQLAMEILALVDAGLLWRFPATFTPGMITWDRWVWAAATYESRVVAVSSLPSWIWSDDSSSSPSRIWESCGVMVPLLDMLNHEDNAAQVTWQKTTIADGDDGDASVKRLNLITIEKTKKHMQLYRNYGILDNEHFMMQYGFTRMSNPADKVRIAWALIDGVGGVAPPKDYEPDESACSGSVPASYLVYESSDPESLKAWWTEQRLTLLGCAVQNNADTLESLKRGKKITYCAFNNGKIDRGLLAVAVVTTLPPAKVEEMYSKLSNTTSSKPLEGFVLDQICQNTMQRYLRFLFSKKLEKLLQSLNSCLKDHFNSVQLWTKASMGGLNYVADNMDGAMSFEGGGGENSSTVVGWQSFFDNYVWYSTMEVEERYYSMAPDSCVLTLYDGHVRSLQSSLDILATDAAHNDTIKRMLEDLGCVLDSTTSYPMPADVEPIVQPIAAAATESLDEQVMLKNIGEEDKAQDPPKKDDQGNVGLGSNQGNGNKRDRDRRKDKSKGDRPPAIKLHIGNLSYKTLPNQLYDFFTSLYGKGSVLECHIPTERDTGNSRGFGFVTMPDNHAKAALESGRKHEMDGRILKVAESNSVGSGKSSKGGRNNMPPAPSSDRCSNCGYRPRWCTCNPNMMPMNNMGRGGPPPPDYMYGMRPYMPPPPLMGGGPGYGHPHDMDDRHMGGGDGHGWGGGGNFGAIGSRRSLSRSPSYRRERDRGYRRSRSYSRSRSRSYSRGRDRNDRHRDRGRQDEGRRRYDDDSRRGSSRRYRSKSRSRSRQRDSSVSPNRGRPNDDAGNFSDDPEAGRSRSRSLSPNDGNAMDRSAKKREGKDVSGRSDGRSRSRDHGSRRRKRSKGSRRGKESSKRRGGSRSRSRDRH